MDNHVDEPAQNADSRGTARPREWKSAITWIDPNFIHPPINEPILVIVGSSVDRGRGFEPHYTLETIKVLAESPDGDEDAYFTDEKWDDMQLKCVTTDLDDERDYYSDSIKWWAQIPAIAKATGASK